MKISKSGLLGLIVVILIALGVELAQADNTAILVNEYISGTNRICVYEGVSGKIAITIKDYQVCPYTIRD